MGRPGHGDEEDVGVLIMKPGIESDGKKFWIRDGRGLEEPIPVIILGHVDPDEKNAGQSGEGISPSGRQTEGFFGPRQNVNPGEIGIAGAVMKTDAAGDFVGDLFASPGIGKRLRVLHVSVHGLDATPWEATVNIGTSIEITGVKQNYPIDMPANAKEAEDTAIVVIIADGGNELNYAIHASARYEDVVE